MLNPYLSANAEIIFRSEEVGSAAQVVAGCLGLLLGAALLVPVAAGATGAPTPRELRVLIIDGQNNHQWQVTTPVLKNILENTGRFQVNVVTAPRSGVAASTFDPDFNSYDAVLSNYNGEAWPGKVRTSFERFVREGGGFVVFHAADNSFPDSHKRSYY